MKKLSSLGKVLFIALLLMVAWEVLVYISRVPTYLFPSLSEVIVSAVASKEQLISGLLITGSEAILGFIIANVFAYAVALLIFSYPNLKNIILPYLISIKAIPVITIAPLITIWLGHGFNTKVYMSALVCFFPVILTLAQSSVDNDLLDQMKSWQATKLDQLRHLYIPSSMPALFAGLKISAPLAVIGAVISEFVASSGGLGYLLLVYTYSLNTPLVFAVVFLSSFLSVCIYVTVLFVERQLKYSN